MAARAQARRQTAPAPWQLPYHRRVSGPSRASQQQRRSAKATRPAVAGRALIGLIALLVLGVVLLQVEVLRVNAQLGRELARRQSLSRAVVGLQAEDSALSAPARVAAEAQQLGMVPIGEGAATFLDPSPSQLEAAIARLRGPAGRSEGEGSGGGP